MPKVKSAGDPIFFPKGLPKIDRQIVLKMIEFNALQSNLELIMRRLATNQDEYTELTAELKLVRHSLNKKQMELSELYRSKIHHCTVAYNRDTGGKAKE